MTPSRWSMALLAVLATPTAAQLSGWLNNQVNASICTWAQPRAALIRDTVYIDGGQLRWSPGLDDGRFGQAVLEKNLDGTVFTFTLNTTVKDDTNVSAALVGNLITKPGGAGLKPYFWDGAMLYNDAEAFLFGGAMVSIDKAYDPPARDDVIVYQAYDVGPDKPLWKRGFYTKRTGEDVNRYVAYGAGASAPSENKAWYFSGLTSPSKGQIDTVANANFTNWAQDVSNRMITVDMSTQNDEKWSNNTIDPDVDGRANPEMVWVPVGKEGILVVLGGVTYPQWAWTENSQRSDDPEASRNESSEFMRVIDIYDVASGDWYKQETVDGPDALTRGCAVVAVSSDQSSYNIYYYGGFDGINNNEPFNDEVWVLSLPSFTWHRINEGREIHARAGHKCFKPYADQMMVFGGYTSQTGGSIPCLEGGPVVTFNLSSGEWMDEYNPKNFDDYAVPSKVIDKIGGNGAGGATLVTPSPDGWSARGLGEIFGESYDMDKITTFGPYNATESSERPTLPGDDDNDDDGGGGGGLPSWVAPVLGVIIGLIVIITAIVLFCLWKRRGIFKNRSSASGTEDPGMRIMSWMRGHQNEKPVTLTSTEETPASPEMGQSHGMHHHPHYGMNSVATGTATTTTTPGLELPPNRYEVADTQLAELHDTSPPAELPDSPLSHNDVLLKHSHLGKGSKDPSTFSSPSYSSFSFAAGADHASSISRSSAAANSNMPLTGNRDTPPAGGSTPDPEASRVTSGVSGISDTDIGHLRHVSETSIDANLASNSARGSPPPVTGSSRPGFGLRGDSNTLAEETPISPPTAGDEPSEDYISARGNLVSPLRKSVFRESEEDMRKD